MTKYDECMNMLLGEGTKVPHVITCFSSGLLASNAAETTRLVTIRNENLLSLAMMELPRNFKKYARYFVITKSFVDHGVRHGVRIYLNVA